MGRKMLMGLPGVMALKSVGVKWHGVTPLSKVSTFEAVDHGALNVVLGRDPKLDGSVAWKLWRRLDIDPFNGEIWDF